MRRREEGVVGEVEDGLADCAMSPDKDLEERAGGVVVGFAGGIGE